MESISVETDWDGLTLSSLAAAGRSNISPSPLFISKLNPLNSSHNGSSFVGAFPNIDSTTNSLTLSPPRQRNEDLAQAEIAVLGVILALTTLGNGFVLWVLLRRRKQNTAMHVFMVNLCVADLVVAFFQVLPQLIWDITETFQGPDLLCRFVKYLQIVGMFASSYMIVAMTLDRHHAICYPLQAYRGWAMSRCNTPVIVAWGLSLLLSLPQVFIFSRFEINPGEFECWAHFSVPWGLKAYVTWMTVAVFLLPAIIITTCQIRIFREIHNNIYLKSERVVMIQMRRNDSMVHSQNLNTEDERASVRGRQGSGGGSRDGRGGHLFSNTPRNSQQQPLTNSDCQESHLNHEVASNSPRCSFDIAPPPSPASPPQSITKAMSKTVRMTLVIVLVYTICWSPFFVVQLWAAWDPDPPIQGVAFTILMLLASLNSCTNPWIYTAFSSSVSTELQTLLHCHSQSRRRSSLPNDSTITHASITKDNQY
ncbi:vasopressin V2 receptor isoform X2 [Thalassophryne amazonica]|uniref:vasopressin V2 receptor isoform X2 n=1 Tax=Thalassophryne amazonica TaxID=390379 RepID=UPI001470E54B|nr:vasopressin V2 receptor isoform X2 [Thalassophryne amazonica]